VIDERTALARAGVVLLTARGPAAPSVCSTRVMSMVAESEASSASWLTLN
jgi:hypothetical protein